MNLYVSKWRRGAPLMATDATGWRRWRQVWRLL